MGDNDPVQDTKDGKKHSTQRCEVKAAWVNKSVKEEIFRHSFWSGTGNKLKQSPRE